MGFIGYNAKREELAYIAGLLDGEGCIQINGDKYSMNINIRNTVKAPLEFVEGILGGSIHSYLPKRGYICYTWRLCGAKAAIVLGFLLPYLIIKKERAILAIEFVSVPDKYRKDEIRLEMTVLNRRWTPLLDLREED